MARGGHNVDMFKVLSGGEIINHIQPKGIYIHCLG